MERYRKINSITGWFTFLIAAVVYLLTIEPTASFWDCGEFISTAFKLEVGHPPGAPFFMILGRFFTLFAGGDVTKVAPLMNSLSALASAFTILFLFWTITHFARKIIVKNNEYTTTGILSIMGAGLVGALAYTFSDTFWFSAVEAEVYATSSLFTAVVFWAILKWENVADEKHSTQWIILIAYLMGLSIGVHLLNLLAIPAIVFVYYFKKYKVTRNGIIYALLVSVLILGAVMYIVIPGIVKFTSWFELFFVNVLNLPYKTGVIIFAIVFIGSVIYGIKYTLEHGKVVLNTIILGFAVMIIGYSSYSMIVIRSLADPPMDQNDPETIFSLLRFLNREQYGDRPLVKGQYYNAPVIDVKRTKPTYTQQDGKYIVTNRKPEYIYDPDFTTIFPRMYSEDPRHVEAYKEWGRVKGIPMQIQNRAGETETVNKPTFGENLRFFWNYQMGFMYWRYFMWNFAGRQNDIQGHGNKLHGNWLSGIQFIDEYRLGPQEDLPDSLANNKARNKYYLLPLLLGIAGIFYQYSKDKKDFSIVTMLFVLTGIAIVIYLNQTPYQPRERDYAYAGSFYAFAIWIGIGVLWLTELFKKIIAGPVSPILSTLLAAFLVPGIMAAENWDDHDRSGRYTARDFAYNYLNSCAPNAILFTMGDNDTFPLWYAQEVEGIRTDVRVVNLSYLGADWYIEQMERKAYESDPLPFSLEKDKYLQGTRDVVYIVERFNRPVNLKEAIDFLASDDDRTKTMPNYRERIDYLPSKKFFLPVDSQKIMQTGTVSEKFADDIVNTIEFSLDRNLITKSDMMVLDLLAHANWERPIYFAITVARDNYLNLENYFQIHGLAYKIVPVKANTEAGQIGSIDTDIMYNNMINVFKWGGIESGKDIYLDENNLRMLTNFRNNFARLANALIDEGKTDSARIVLDKCMELMPHERIPYNYFNLPLGETYYKLNMPEKGNEIFQKLANITLEEINFYFRLAKQFPDEADYERRLNVHIIQEIVRITKQYDQQELSDSIQSELEMILMPYN
ncbi:MAG: protein O-mannosyl-transferase family [Bacteroidales bacterium]